jgi:hypothetical protein
MGIIRKIVIWGLGSNALLGLAECQIWGSSDCCSIAYKQMKGCLLLTRTGWWW